MYKYTQRLLFFLLITLRGYTFVYWVTRIECEFWIGHHLVVELAHEFQPVVGVTLFANVASHVVGLCYALGNLNMTEIDDQEALMKVVLRHLDARFRV